ncbi:hypothetical protein LPJ53_000742 [Coemansia erecta]|uniref:FAM50A/XAP5 C-terminal domain-containing protein n=1 Tax=Coemansia erecta TaxID=147472 RepID=A0A9W7Y4Z3_9FUNG|nr:hypothetical protein LPJ53_000742 [Coemansia erecta]
MNAGGERGGKRRQTDEQSVEARLKQSTIGLVHLSDFRRIKSELEEHRQRAAAQTLGTPLDKPPPPLPSSSQRQGADEAPRAHKKPKTDKEKKGKKKKGKKREAKKLSFGSDSESDNDDHDGTMAAPVGKNPAVDTSFLPDAQRDQADASQREALRQQWLSAQAQQKQQPLLITYSYWDGTGHRRQTQCQQGDTISVFLSKCRAQVGELHGRSVDSLMFVKEDVILPHHLSFYDLITSRARGKSGALFDFGVHEDVRVSNDAARERDEAHAGKVCERAWYERNKHIFPASRWEMFDPEKDYGRYTVK